MTVTILLSLLFACGLENAKYGDSGLSDVVDPDTLDESGDDDDGDDGGDDDDGDDDDGDDGDGADSGAGTGGGTGTGGSSDPCEETEVLDCDDVCISASELFRIDDDTCDESYPNLNCFIYAYDGGDCDEETDDDGGAATGDDEADYPAVPGGPCERFDDTIGVYDCLAESCRPEWWLGDEICDWTYDMDCEATDWDGGDCDPEDGGGTGTIVDECYDVAWYEVSPYFIDPSDDPYTDAFTMSCGGVGGSTDVAYTVRPPVSGDYCITVEVADTSEGTSIAPVVSVWESDCMTELVCSAGSVSEPSGSIERRLESTETYLVVVEHRWSFDSGYFELNIEPCPFAL